MEAKANEEEKTACCVCDAPCKKWADSNYSSCVGCSPKLFVAAGKTIREVPSKDGDWFPKQCVEVAGWEKDTWTKAIAKVKAELLADKERQDIDDRIPCCICDTSVKDHGPTYHTCCLECSPKIFAAANARYVVSDFAKKSGSDYFRRGPKGKWDLAVEKAREEHNSTPYKTGGPCCLCGVPCTFGNHPSGRGACKLCSALISEEYGGETVFGSSHDTIIAGLKAERQASFKGTCYVCSEPCHQAAPGCYSVCVKHAVACYQLSSEYMPILANNLLTIRQMGGDGLPEGFSWDKVIETVKAEWAAAHPIPVETPKEKMVETCPCAICDTQCKKQQEQFHSLCKVCVPKLWKANGDQDLATDPRYAVDDWFPRSGGWDKHIAQLREQALKDRCCLCNTSIPIEDKTARYEVCFPHSEEVDERLNLPKGLSFNEGKNIFFDGNSAYASAIALIRSAQPSENKMTIDTDTLNLPKDNDTTACCVCSAPCQKRVLTPACPACAKLIHWQERDGDPKAICEWPQGDGFPTSFNDAIQKVRKLYEENTQEFWVEKRYLYPDKQFSSEERYVCEKIRIPKDCPHCDKQVKVSSVEESSKYSSSFTSPCGHYCYYDLISKDWRDGKWTTPILAAALKSKKVEVIHDQDEKPEVEAQKSDTVETQKPTTQSFRVGNHYIPGGTELLGSGYTELQIPTSCPDCNKPLVKSGTNYPDYFSKTCEHFSTYEKIVARRLEPKEPMDQVQGQEIWIDRYYLDKTRDDKRIKIVLPHNCPTCQKKIEITDTGNETRSGYLGNSTCAHGATWAQLLAMRVDKPKPPMTRNEFAEKIIDVLKDHAYPFGGYLRDQIVGAEFEDIDLFMPHHGTYAKANEGKDIQCPIEILTAAGFEVLYCGSTIKDYEYSGKDYQLTKQNLSVKDSVSGHTIPIDVVSSNAPFLGADSPNHLLGAEYEGLFRNQYGELRSLCGYGSENLKEELKRNFLSIHSLAALDPKRLIKLLEKGYTTQYYTGSFVSGDRVVLEVRDDHDGVSFVEATAVCESPTLGTIFSLDVEGFQTKDKAYAAFPLSLRDEVKPFLKTLDIDPNKSTGWHANAAHTKVVCRLPAQKPIAAPVQDEATPDLLPIQGLHSLQVGEMIRVKIDGAFFNARVISNACNGCSFHIDIGQPLSSHGFSTGFPVGKDEKEACQRFGIEKPNLWFCRIEDTKTQILGRIPPPTVSDLQVRDRVRIKIAYPGQDINEVDATVIHKTSSNIQVDLGISRLGSSLPADAQAKQIQAEGDHTGGTCWYLPDNNTSILYKLPPLSPKEPAMSKPTIDHTQLKEGDRVQLQVSWKNEPITATVIDPRYGGYLVLAADEADSKNLAGWVSSHWPRLKSFGVDIQQKNCLYVLDSNPGDVKFLQKLDPIFVDPSTLNVGDEVLLQVIDNAGNYHDVVGMVALNEVDYLYLDLDDEFQSKDGSISATKLSKDSRFYKAVEALDRDPTVASCFSIYKPQGLTHPYYRITKVLNRGTQPEPNQHDNEQETSEPTENEDTAMDYIKLLQPNDRIEIELTDEDGEVYSREATVIDTEYDGDNLLIHLDEEVSFDGMDSFSYPDVFGKAEDLLTDLGIDKGSDRFWSVGPDETNFKVVKRLTPNNIIPLTSLKYGDKVRIQVMDHDGETRLRTATVVATDFEEYEGAEEHILVILDEEIDTVDWSSFDIPDAYRGACKRLGLDTSGMLAWTLGDTSTKVLEKINRPAGHKKERDAMIDENGDEVTVVEELKEEMAEAAYRVVATQATTIVQQGILLAWKDKGADDTAIRYVREFLESEMGRALISVGVGHGLKLLPGDMKHDPRVLKLAKEMRVDGMATVTNEVIGAAMQYVLPGITEAIKTLPPAEDFVKEATGITVAKKEKKTRVAGTGPRVKQHPVAEHDEENEESTSSKNGAATSRGH
jgi:hypothetical protein